MPLQQCCNEDLRLVRSWVGRSPMARDCIGTVWRLPFRTLTVVSLGAIRREKQYRLRRRKHASYDV